MFRPMVLKEVGFGIPLSIRCNHAHAIRMFGVQWSSVHRVRCAQVPGYRFEHLPCRWAEPLYPAAYPGFDVNWSQRLSTTWASVCLRPDASISTVQSNLGTYLEDLPR